MHAADGPARYDGGPSVAELLAERFGPDVAEAQRLELLAVVRRERFCPSSRKAERDGRAGDVAR